MHQSESYQASHHRSRSRVASRWSAPTASAMQSAAVKASTTRAVGGLAGVPLGWRWQERGWARARGVWQSESGCVRESGCVGRGLVVCVASRSKPPTPPRRVSPGPATLLTQPSYYPGPRAALCHPRSISSAHPSHPPPHTADVLTGYAQYMQAAAPLRVRRRGTYFLTSSCGLLSSASSSS